MWETNHIALRGVDAIGQALNGDPFNRHLRDPPLSVVVAVVDLLGEAKVGHTDVHILVQPETARQELQGCITKKKLIIYTEKTDEHI